MHTRVREFGNTHPPHPQHPPLAESTYNLHKPQHPSTGHPRAFGLRLGLGFGSGVRRQAPRPRPPYKCTRYYIPGTMYLGTRYSSINSTFHRVYINRCISNSHTRVRIYIESIEASQVPPDLMSNIEYMCWCRHHSGIYHWYCILVGYLYYL